jgi:hypothetical protein
MGLITFERIDGSHPSRTPRATLDYPTRSGIIGRVPTPGRRSLGRCRASWRSQRRAKALGFHSAHLRGIDRGGPSPCRPGGLGLNDAPFGATKRRSPTELLPYAALFVAGQRRTKMSPASKLLKNLENFKTWSDTEFGTCPGGPTKFNYLLRSMGWQAVTKRHRANQLK